MLDEAFTELFPEKPAHKFNDVIYSGRIKFYNAYVTLKDMEITVRVSKNYEGVDRDILIGVIQSLFSRLYKKKITTKRMIKARQFLSERSLEYKPMVNNEVPDELRNSFQRVNLEYFDNSLSLPVINWGRYSFRRLGQYISRVNLIKISRMLEHAPAYALDYIMYHEMLHLHRDKDRRKHAKAHTNEFKRLENKFRQSMEANEWIRSNVSKRKSAVAYFG